MLRPLQEDGDIVVGQGEEGRLVNYSISIDLQASLSGPAFSGHRHGVFEHVQSIRCPVSPCRW